MALFVRCNQQLRCALAKQRPIVLVRRSFVASRGEKKEITASKKAEDATPSTTVHKVVGATKTASYGLVVAGGLAIIGVALYYLLGDLFSSESPVALFNHAADTLKADSNVQALIGTPIMTSASEHGRRRQNITYSRQTIDGKETISILVVLTGSRNNGTAIAVFAKENGKYVEKKIIGNIAGHRIFIKDEPVNSISLQPEDQAISKR